MPRQATRAQVAPVVVTYIDDASPGDATAAVVAGFPGAVHLRHRRNAGGRAAFRTGMLAALAEGASDVWVRDDDGLPVAPNCLEGLLGLAAEGFGIAAPLVLDEADHARIAFAFRMRGRSRFRLEERGATGRVEGVARLFDGTLVAAAVIRRVGPPDPRFPARGDEAEFLPGARRAGFRVASCLAARFAEPGGMREVHPILGGRFMRVPFDPPEVERVAAGRPAAGERPVAANDDLAEGARAHG